ncbi:MAG: class I SAM-dependent methyltransferase [Candidatus Heimdallarchaeota archaeon]|nr:class I SAM-dependent methyltransferase [Candidatus Heimdallarchaeota archaeon]
MEKFNLYGNEFSQIYDRFWSDFIDEIGPKISDIYLKYSTPNVENSRVLDLCCGTGRLSKILCDQGYKVVGLDQSSSMLELARMKLHKEINLGSAKFVEGLAQQFDFEENFDFVISTFDSINHLSNIEDVRSCFINVFNNLNEGGCFIFDLNTKYVLKNWNFVDLDESDDKSIVYIMHGKYDVGENKAYTRVMGFIDKLGDGCYKRFDELMFNSIFELEEIIQILKEVGFTNCAIYDSSLENLVASTKALKDRVFIVAY